MLKLYPILQVMARPPRHSSGEKTRSSQASPCELLPAPLTLCQYIEADTGLPARESHHHFVLKYNVSVQDQVTIMDNRIGLELRGKKKCEVTELDLSGCNTGGEIVGLTEEFSALEQLDLQNASLTNIKLFPKLAKLSKLDLSGNRLSKGLEVLKDCPNIKSLSLSNNKFKDLSTLEPLKDLQYLQHLELEDNEFPEAKEDFRTKIFELLPNLEVLDGKDKVGAEVNSGDEDSEEDEADEDDVEDEEDDSGEEEDSEEDGEDGPGLSALYDNTADLDDDDEADYEGNEAEGDDSDLEDEDEEDGEPTPDGKGVKRKLEEDH